MLLPARSAGHGRRPQWPLAAAWVVSVASLLAVALLSRPAEHTYGTLLLAGSAGSLIVVLAYARLLRRGSAPPPTVLLLGGPWEGRMQLTRAGPMPEEVLLAGQGMPPCSYRRRLDDGDRPQLRILRYEPCEGPETAATFQQPVAP